MKPVVCELLEYQSDMYRNMDMGPIFSPSHSHQRQRLFFCPTGAFMLLPLHAAGTYGVSASRTCLTDYFVASYTLTLGALIQAREARPLVRRSQMKALVAAVPDPFRGSPLMFALDEVAQITSIIPRQSIIPFIEPDQSNSIVVKQRREMRNSRTRPVH
jgi:hypothetical protein